MTDATTQKPIQDPEAFGRDIAQHARAELESIGLSIAVVDSKQRQIASIVQRMARSIDAAAAAQIMEGIPSAEAQAWAKAALKSCGAAMVESRATA